MTDTLPTPQAGDAAASNASARDRAAPQAPAADAASSQGLAAGPVASGQPTVHVVLPVHGRKAVTLQFVRCLLAQTYTQYRLLLVDDGSTDGTAGAVRALLPGCEVLTGDGQWWWAGSLHQAYLHLAAQGAPADDLVLICNDDTCFEADFLANAVAALRGKQNCMMLAQLDERAQGGGIEVGVHIAWRGMRIEGVSDPARVNCFATRGLFQRVDDFISLGGFHPRMLPHYFSDYEYTIRAYQRGRKLLTDPSVRLTFNSETTGTRVLKETTLRGHLKEVFSKRYVGNPWYKSMFILLACPPLHVPGNLYLAWKYFFIDMGRMLRQAPAGS